MKDAECADANEKSIFRFLRFSVLEIRSVLYTSIFFFSWSRDVNLLILDMILVSKYNYSTRGIDWCIYENLKITQSDKHVPLWHKRAKIGSTWNLMKLSPSHWNHFLLAPENHRNFVPIKMKLVFSSEEAIISKIKTYCKLEGDWSSRLWNKHMHGLTDAIAIYTPLNVGYTRVFQCTKLKEKGGMEWGGRRGGGGGLAMRSGQRSLFTAEAVLLSPHHSSRREEMDLLPECNFFSAVEIFTRLSL